MDPSSPPAVLQASLSPWYYRRTLVLFLLFAGFGAYFAYDWKVGYPRKKVETDQAIARYRELYSQGESGRKQWADESAARRWEIKDTRTMEPVVMTDAKIREQFYGAIVCGVVALVVAVQFARSRGTILAADEETVRLPGGKQVRYDEIFRVDTRKWGKKGLAYLWFKGAAGAGRAVIDGMKYGGFKGPKPYVADQILERIVERFRGELIELQAEPEEEDGRNGAGQAAS